MLNLDQVILFIILGIVLAIVYSLRILVLVERRMARIELHIERMAGQIVKEEYKIESYIGKPRSAAVQKILPRKKK